MKRAVGSGWVVGLARSTETVIVIASTSFVLGFLGYVQAGGVSIATAIYDTLQLFTLQYTAPAASHGASMPVALELARFLAPAVTVLAAVGAAARVFRDRFDRFTARRSTGHVVVCGLGRVGSAAVARLRAHGHQVVAIERDAQCFGIRAARVLGVPVIVGDARSKRTLERARVGHAARLIWSASDWVEGQGLVDALGETVRDDLASSRSLLPRTGPARTSAHACLVRVRDLALCAALRLDVLARDNGYSDLNLDVDFFNEAENVAQRLLWSVTRGYAAIGEGEVDLWVVGDGLLAEAIIVQAAHNWWGVPQLRPRPSLAIHLFCPDATEVAERIEASWPEVTMACRLEPHAGPPEIATSPLRAKVPPTRDAHAAFVVVEGQERAVQIGLRLMEDPSIAHVAVAAEPRICSWGETTRLLLFDPSTHGLESAVLLFDTYELLARMIHEHYTLRGRVQADGSLEAATDPFSAGHEWDALDPFWRASNRDAARFIVPNLLATGHHVRRLSARRDPQPPPERMRLGESSLDAMAEREHERWRKFMAAHNWTYGPRRDTALHTNPNLVPWSEASPAARLYTTTAVSEYPRLLAQLGYEVRR